MTRNFSTSIEIHTLTETLERIANELLSLNKMERFDYSIFLRHKMGVGSASAAAPQAAKEKTAFDVKLEKFDASAKLKVIKEIRAFTDLGLKEAKDLVEKAPVVVKKGVLKDEAEKIVQKLKEVGATVVLE
ncbi:50S ribosomal L7 L12-like isoform X3 [Olea europaea subsp. europaea]|uniref:Large ribosomal subunit protein bL12c n=1 Tax=Olea europaea subsp. europaea TaxID=158383 RepID=A0A8S0Q026_OLEEU|nr:50S ribosomal L7 L12-like isoform X3 [Olea europaea subsp. europaea]